MTPTRPLELLLLSTPATRAPVAALESRLAAHPRARVRHAAAHGVCSAVRAATSPADIVAVPDTLPSVSRALRAMGRRTLRFGAVAEGAESAFLAAAARAAARPGAGLPLGRPVSVVATVLDEAQGIDALVDDVGAQLRDGDELLIVDGGSRDGTLDRLDARAADEPRLRVLLAPGTNISAGRNAGIAAAANDVIATTDVGCVPVEGWLDALRQAFAEEPPPGMAAGNCGVAAHTALERAQAIACYPDPEESRRPDLHVRLYGRLFGQTFDPTLPFARSLAFTRSAWAAAGGFPEDLGWTEDGVFGRRIARRRPVVFASDALVWWQQRGGLRATARMYHRYGLGAAQSGEPQLEVRDLVRGGAYLLAIACLLARRRAPLAALTACGALYVSVPVRRGVRKEVGPLALAAVPLAMAIKDLGKLSGALRSRIGGGDGRG